MNQVILITGGNSGIGLQTALLLQKAGCQVYEISRNNIEHPGIVHIGGDITSADAVQTAVDSVIQAEGRIDVLINNAGFGISGAVEFTEISSAQKQLDVNFFGMVRLCHSVLPYMRKAGKGKIINLSSVAAVIPIPFQTFYSASKAAINAYSFALGNEVRPYGISVCAVMPGDICTGFTASREKTIAGDAEYDGRLSRSVAKMEKDERSGMDPASVAHFIAKLVRKRTLKPLYSIRLDYRFFVLLSRLLPVRIFNWLVYQLYAR